MDDNREVLQTAVSEQETDVVTQNESALALKYRNWTDGLERPKKGGKPYQTIANALYGLKYCPELGSVQYNEFTGAKEVNGVPWTRYSNRISDMDVHHIYYEMEKGGITNRTKIDSAIEIMAYQNAYHPVRNYLNSLRWDGESHIANLFPKYLGAEKSGYTTIVTMVMFGGIEVVSLFWTRRG